MEALIEQKLWEIKSSIEPTEAQKDGAIRSHTYLRELLQNSELGKCLKGSFLSGSYARDTAIRPIDDVDVIFVIDEKSWKNINTGYLAHLMAQTSEIRQDYKSGSVAQALFGQSQYPEPNDVLEKFANAIRYRYPVSSIFNQRRSIRLSLNHLDIDVVPAIALDQNAINLLIPDSESNKWIQTAPKLHAEQATRVNQLRSGRFKPLVKLLKRWNSNIPSTVRFKSFCIETIATRIFLERDFKSLTTGLLFFWDFCAQFSDQKQLYPFPSKFGIKNNLFTRELEVPDASGTGSNVASGMSNDQVRKFGEHAVRSRDRLIAAIESANANDSINYLKDAMYML
jgi:hypothetical protein